MLVLNQLVKMLKDFKDKKCKVAYSTFLPRNNKN